MPADGPADAAGFARRHAGEREPDLTPQQRDLLGRVVAKRLERGAKLEAIARAAGGAFPELENARAERLGRDAALQAIAWAQLQGLRAAGADSIGISPAGDACPACRAAYGQYAAAEAPEVPIASCTHPGGCRCIYVAGTALPPPEPAPDSPDEDETPARPWYRPRPPRPHPPRWTEEQREAARRRNPQAGGKRRTNVSAPAHARPKRTRDAGQE
jgi:hypothetical protein